MAITTNSLKAKDVDFSTRGPMRMMEATQSDTDYFADPDDAEVQIISKGISILNPDTQDIVLVNVEGQLLTIPGGALAEGVIHPIPGIVRVNDTNTGATVRVFVWF